MKPTLILAILILSSSIVFAQSEGQIYRSDREFLSKIKVIDGGNTKLTPWAGGQNNPQFTTADLNNDGKQDLVVFEKISGVKTYLNVGTPGNARYEYAPEFQYKIPPVSQYLQMKDYNCDNIPDLFHYGWYGLQVCVGYYDAGNLLSFTNCRNIKYNYVRNDGSIDTSQDLGVGPDDIPSIVDYDHDGDLDVITYSKYGSVIRLYKNIRAEEGLPCNTLKYKLGDNCWGRVRQDALREHSLGIYCEKDGLRPAAPESDEYSGNFKTTHGNNSLCLLDIDGDGDYDYLDGNASFSDIQFLRNGKVETNHPVDTFISQDTTWQSNGTKLFMPSFPTAYWLDVDQDNDKDILIAPHSSTMVENYNCVAYYKNTGSDASPSFTYQTNTYLIDDMIDMGGNTYPFVYDYNKDGLLDLLVGSLGRYQPASGTFKSRIAYYENTGTATAPVFTLKDDNFLLTGAMNLNGGAIAIGDLDNDGMDELLIGRQNGTIAYFRNYAANSAAQPDWKLWQKELRAENGTEIALREYVTPFIYDMNKDGKKDLIFGNATGYISYYKNNGTTTGQLALGFVTNKLGDLKTYPPTDGYSAPFIGKMDNTGVEYLMVGSVEGVIYRYDGFQSGNLTTPFIRKDSSYSEIIFPGRNITISIADIDNDGKYEMFAGNDLGGVYLYRQVWDVNVDQVEKERKQVNIYPNPAKDKLNITLNGDVLPADAKVKIYNSMGQLENNKNIVYSNNTFTVDVASLPVGLYLCTLEYSGEKQTALFNKYE